MKLAPFRSLIVFHLFFSLTSCNKPQFVDSNEPNNPSDDLEIVDVADDQKVGDPESEGAIPSGADETTDAFSDELLVLAREGDAAFRCSKLLRERGFDLFLPQSFEGVSCWTLSFGGPARKVTRITKTINFAIPSNALPSNAVPLDVLSSQAIPSNITVAGSFVTESIDNTVKKSGPLPPTSNLRYRLASTVQEEKSLVAVLTMVTDKGLLASRCAIDEGSIGMVNRFILCRTEGMVVEDIDLVFFLGIVDHGELEAILIGDRPLLTLPLVIGLENGFGEDPLRSETPSIPDNGDDQTADGVKCRTWENPNNAQCVPILSAYYQIDESELAHPAVEPAVIKSHPDIEAADARRMDGDGPGIVIVNGAGESDGAETYPNERSPESRFGFAFSEGDYFLFDDELLGSEEGSILFWVYPINIGRAWNDEAMVPRSLLILYRYGLYAAILPDGTLQWYGGIYQEEYPDGNPLRSSQRLTNGRWYHLALLYGPAGRKIFIDGVGDASDAIEPDFNRLDGFPYPSDSPDSCADKGGIPFCTPSFQPTSVANWDLVSGLLDEVMLARVRISDEEVCRIFKAKFDASCP